MSSMMASINITEGEAMVPPEHIGVSPEQINDQEKVGCDL